MWNTGMVSFHCSRSSVIQQWSAKGWLWLLLCCILTLHAHVSFFQPFHWLVVKMSAQDMWELWALLGLRTDAPLRKYLCSTQQGTVYQRCECETLGKLLQLPWVSVSSPAHDDIIQDHGLLKCEWARIDQALSIVSGTWAFKRSVTLPPALASPRAPTPNRASDWLEVGEEH